MEIGFEFANVVAITVVAFLIGMVWKRTSLDDKWIPIICGVVGLILGIVAFFIKMPDFPANDIISAAAVGIMSGLAATGVHQIGKQLSNKEEE